MRVLNKARQRIGLLTYYRTALSNDLRRAVEGKKRSKAVALIERIRGLTLEIKSLKKGTRNVRQQTAR